MWSSVTTKNEAKPKSHTSRKFLNFILMKKVSLSTLVLIVFAVLTFSSCTTINKSMREPNSHVEFTKGDFSYSDQVSAEASCTKIFSIDFTRLFTKKTGSVEGGAAAISLASIPVIGNIIADQTANYALYELMEKNAGYDVVFYPQYEIKVVKPLLGLGFLTKITTVKVTAKLGKLK